jgi:hypothetical protein
VRRGRKGNYCPSRPQFQFFGHTGFVPEQEIRELRELLRTRKQLGQQQASHVQRLQKTLEGASYEVDEKVEFGWLNRLRGARERAAMTHK